MRRCSALVIIFALLAGCQILKSPVKEDNTGDFYHPPTAVENTNSNNPVTQQTTPTPSNNNGINGSSRQTDCTDNLVFIDDLTIPDGTEVSPNAMLDKQWVVENQGTCNWDESYRLQHIAGSTLGATPEQALFPARSGSQIILQLQFIAPQEAGNYRSAWQAISPSGEPFGDPVFIEIVVVEETPSS